MGLEESGKKRLLGQSIIVRNILRKNFITISLKDRIKMENLVNA